MIKGKDVILEKILPRIKLHVQFESHLHHVFKFYQLGVKLLI